MIDTVVIFGEDVCCSMVCLIIVLYCLLLMTSSISCPLWSSVYECQRVEYVLTSPVRIECGIYMMCCMQCCMSRSTVSYFYVQNSNDHRNITYDPTMIYVTKYHNPWSCHSSFKPAMGARFTVLGQARRADPLDGWRCSS